MSQDEKGIDSDLIRGHIDTIILKVLKTGDRYGLEIIEDVTASSGGLYELKQPTLYSCLKRLEGQGLISSYWTDSDIGGKRHYYKLTDEGKNVLEKNQNDWAKSRSIIESLIYETPQKTETNNIITAPQESSLASNSDVDAQVFDSIDSCNENDTIDNFVFDEPIENNSEIQSNDLFETNSNDENTEEEKPVQDNQENFAEDELLAFAELDREREAQKPTALEIAAAEEKMEDITPSIVDDGSEIEFSTFSNSSSKTNNSDQIFNNQLEEIKKQSKQNAIDILFGSDDKADSNIETNEDIAIENNSNESDFSLNESNAIESKNYEEKIILPSEIPQTPTPEQKQTLKMFEANSVNASLTDNGYKERLTELSSFVKRNNARLQPLNRKEIEYHPEDYNSISTRFKQWGISVRSHQKIERTKEEKNHILSNKIQMVRSWLTFGITALALVISLAILIPIKPAYMTAKNALPIYIVCFAAILTYPVISTIIYTLNPSKRIPAKYAPRLSFIASLLFFIEAIIIIYAINLQTGFVSFARTDYNHLGWIVPLIVSSILMINPTIYYILYKSKRYHC